MLLRWCVVSRRILYSSQTKSSLLHPAFERRYSKFSHLLKTASSPVRCSLCHGWRRPFSDSATKLSTKPESNDEKATGLKRGDQTKSGVATSNVDEELTHVPEPDDQLNVDLQYQNTLPEELTLADPLARCDLYLDNRAVIWDSWKREDFLGPVSADMKDIVQERPFLKDLCLGACDKNMWIFPEYDNNRQANASEELVDELYHFLAEFGRPASAWATAQSETERDPQEEHLAASAVEEEEEDEDGEETEDTEQRNDSTAEHSDHHKVPRTDTEVVDPRTEHGSRGHPIHLVMRGLARMGLLGMEVSKDYGGLNLRLFNQARVFETLAWDLPLVTCLQQHNLAVRFIQQFGSDELKSRVLPLVATGELFLGYARSERASGTDIYGMTTRARPRGAQAPYYTLSGSKSWVTNANSADSLVVLTRIPDKRGPTETRLGLALVENHRETGKTVQVPPSTTMFGSHWQLQGAISRWVSFRETEIPTKNMITMPSVYPDLGRTEIAGLFVTPAVCSAILQTCLCQVTERSETAIRYGKKLSHNSSYALRISNIASLAFVLESLAYHSAGVTDTVENGEFTIETACAHLFAARKLIPALHQVRDMLGVESFGRHPLQKAITDAEVWLKSGLPNDAISEYVAVDTLKHVADHRGVEIRKLRDWRQHPFVLWQYKRDSRKPLKLWLDEHVHPTLITGSDCVEEQVLQLTNLSAEMIRFHGDGVIEHNQPLSLLAEMMSLSYACVASLSRATRAKAIGLSHSDYDCRMALIAVGDLHSEFKVISHHLHDANALVDQSIQYDVAKRTVREQGFPIPHATTRNW